MSEDPGRPIDPAVMAAIAGISMQEIRFPRDVRQDIESAAVKAQQEAGIKRGPVHREQVQTFIRDIELSAQFFTMLNRRWAIGPDGRLPTEARTRDEPARADIEPHLRQMSAALANIEDALSQIPTENVNSLDSMVRLQCLARALGHDAWRERKDEIAERVQCVVDGGAFDVYMPETNGVYSLQSLLHLLKKSIEVEMMHVEGMNPVTPRHAPKLARDTLIENIAQAFVKHLGCQPQTSKRAPTPFQAVLACVLGHLEGKSYSERTIYNLAPRNRRD